MSRKKTVEATNNANAKYQRIPAIAVRVRSIAVPIRNTVSGRIGAVAQARCQAAHAAMKTITTNWKKVSLSGWSDHRKSAGERLMAQMTSPAATRALGCLRLQCTMTATIPR